MIKHFYFPFGEWLAKWIKSKRKPELNHKYLTLSCILHCLLLDSGNFYKRINIELRFCAIMLYMYSAHIIYVYTQTHQEGNLLESLRPLHFFPTDSEIIVFCQAVKTLTAPSTYPDGAGPDSAHPRMPPESTNSSYRMSFPT